MIEDIYNTAGWDSYARSHASVLSSFQLKLFLEAVKHLSGDIIDCGCGSARLAPFLADKRHVTSYTGVDSAEKMVSIAQHLIARVSKKKFRVVKRKIEDIDQKFTSAVSIHSYYSWPVPQAVLQHIFELLTTNSLFVLATPNNGLDMPKLLHEAEKELLCHPDYAEFKQFNLQFANNPKARFVTLDKLIKQVQEIGFKVCESHQRHYLGGVNFLLLKKM